MSTNTYVIAPPNGPMQLNLFELYRYRELLFTLVWRDIKVRYKQTFFGIAWAVLQPFTTMIVFSIFFGGLAKIPSQGIPYPIFVYTGLLFWSYFSNALTQCSNCLIDNENLVKKVYFPRLLLPIAAISTPVVDFVFSWIVLLLLMAYYQVAPILVGIVYIPILLLITCITAGGFGSFLAAINLRYRDVRYILPFFIQLLLFVTPVIYPVTLLPENLRWMMFLNPLSAIIDLSRSMFLGIGEVNPVHILLSIISSLAIAMIGIIYFKKNERFFADLI